MVCVCARTDLFFSRLVRCGVWASPWCVCAAVATYCCLLQAMLIIFYIPALVLCKNTQSLSKGRRGRQCVYRAMVILFWIVGIATTRACVCIALHVVASANANELGWCRLCLCVRACVRAFESVTVSEMGGWFADARLTIRRVRACLQCT